MTVWVLVQHWDENDDVQGVFSSRQKAEEYQIERERRAAAGEIIISSDFSIQEFVLA